MGIVCKNKPHQMQSKEPELIMDVRWQEPMSRRNALRVGGVACGGLLGAASIWSLLRKATRDTEPADVFRGDAPNDEVWALWQKRGWVREARHYIKLDRNVQCKVCPNNCVLEPGDRSHCRNKVNRDGTLWTMAYANPCTFHADPVEKKPLFHFLPGTMTFSLATSGCVFRCLNCQNWEISQKKPEETKDPRGPEYRLKTPVPSSLTLGQLRALSLFPEDIAAIADELGCPSVSYTYSEPTAYYEYAQDCSKAVRERKLKNILVSCGSIEERPLRDLAQYIDAAHIDLKGFDEETYRKLNSGRLEPILNTLKTLKSMGVWVEVINLIVPTYTDNIEVVKRMCGWLVENVGPDTPLHFSRFHPQHKLTHLPSTPINTLLRAREVARAAGLHFVYIGNVLGVPEAETTFCPNCKRAIVERDIYAIKSFKIEDGKCGYCQSPVAGVWKA